VQNAPQDSQRHEHDAAIVHDKRTFAARAAFCGVDTLVLEVQGHRKDDPHWAIHMATNNELNEDPIATYKVPIASASKTTPRARFRHRPLEREN
jgi:hypothetical protein